MPKLEGEWCLAVPPVWTRYEHMTPSNVKWDSLTHTELGSNSNLSPELPLPKIWSTGDKSPLLCNWTQWMPSIFFSWLLIFKPVTCFNFKGSYCTGRPRKNNTIRNISVRTWHMYVQPYAACVPYKTVQSIRRCMHGENDNEDSSLTMEKSPSTRRDLNQHLSICESDMLLHLLF